MGQIPWTTIDRFATRYGIEGEDFDLFEEMIRYIEAQDKRVSAAQSKTPAK